MQSSVLSFEKNFLQNKNNQFVDKDKKVLKAKSQDQIPLNYANTINFSKLNESDSEKTELNICEELTKRMSSFDKIKQKLCDEGSYSKIHLQKQAKKGGLRKIIDEISYFEIEESNKENQVLPELQSNRILAVESVENSQLIRRDINDLKQNLQEKSFIHEFYMRNFEAIHKIQNFFKKRYQKRILNESLPLNIMRKLKLENINLKKQNSKLQAQNKELMLEIQIEKGLDEQKREISAVIQKYSTFIEKLMKDKKDLSLKCEYYSQKLVEKENEFKQYKNYSEDQMNKRKELSNNKTINVKMEELENDFKEKEDDIHRLQQENLELKQKHDLEIQALKNKAHSEYLELESRIKDTISKKDETIRKLNSLLTQMRKNFEDSKEKEI